MPFTVTCYPNSDVLNSGTIIGSATYYGALAQDPHDGDATRIRTVNGGTNICGVDWSPIPSAATPLSVIVRWTEAGTSSDTSLGQAGFWDGVQSYFGTQRSETPHGYQIYNESFPVNPVTGMPWTLTGLTTLMLQHDMVMCPLEAGYPRLTQLVAIVTYDFLAPVHDEASAASLAPEGVASGAAAKAGAASLADSGAASGGGPSGSARGLAWARALLEALAQSGAASGRGARGTGTSIAGCTAIASSLAPIGECAPLAPAASAVWLIPEIGDGE